MSCEPSVVIDVKDLVPLSLADSSSCVQPFADLMYMYNGFPFPKLKATTVACRCKEPIMEPGW